MNILFFGSSDYSYECLKPLLHKYNVVGIITQPDKPKRGKIPEPTFLKEKMKDCNIPIFTPEHIKDEYELIKRINPDLIITAAYGQILPKEIIDIPKYKSINFHASLLPKYKGASPIRQVIINGEKETGITSIFMDEKIDTGKIIYQEKITISNDETYISLYKKFLEKIPDFTLKTIDLVLNGESGKEQENIMSYTNKIKIEDTKINWEENCKEIERKIRAYYPTPGMYGYIYDRKFKIYKVKILDVFHEYTPGTIIRVEKDFIRIACGKGYIDIYELQIPGKKIIKAKDFINGNKKWLKNYCANY